MKLEVGDVLLMYPNLKWYDWFKRIWDTIKSWTVYRFIQENQKRDYKYYKAIHCGVVTDRYTFFEVTYPRAKFTPLETLVGRNVTICRPIGGIPNVAGLQAKCAELYDSDYDIWELVDFFASAVIFKNSRERQAIFDSAKQTVCSTGAALVEKAGGVKMVKAPRNIRPAFYENRPNIFLVTYARPFVI